MLVSSGWWLVARREAVRALRPVADPAVEAAIDEVRQRVETVTTPIGVNGRLPGTARPWRALADAHAGTPPPDGWAALETALVPADRCWAVLSRAQCALAAGDRRAAAAVARRLGLV